LKLAHASLRRLLAEKFHDRRCPVPITLVHKTKRGSISLYEAYCKHHTLQLNWWTFRSR
jgi:hypothetical protein